MAPVEGEVSPQPADRLGRGLEGPDHPGVTDPLRARIEYSPMFAPTSITRIPGFRKDMTSSNSAFSNSHGKARNSAISPSG